MKLAQLLEEAGLADAEMLSRASDIAVSGFAIDHRKVAPGCVFGAFQGERFDAESVIAQAVEAGAIAVVAREQARVEGVLHIASANPRCDFAQLAAGFFAPFPAKTIAVTGTNGKTSCAEMTRQIWRLSGERAASIGTLGVTTPEGSVSTGLTTPDIVTFFGNMSGLAREGVTHVAYEASSHGLSQYRSEGVPLAACAFTNFSRDHLDYHGSMEAYFAAKMRLFSELAAKGTPAIIYRGTEENAWTSAAIALAQERGLDVRTVGEGGDFLRLSDRKKSQLGQSFTITHDNQPYSVQLPLIGGYQLANACVSAGLALATGTSAARVFDALGRLQPVPGRLERAGLTRGGAPLYVDYAHTPDALCAVLESLRDHLEESGAGRLIVVFGAGGDRDSGKRGAMGAAAAKSADIAIVTDDNPRGEEPGTIRAAIMEGASRADSDCQLIDCGDRRAAIARAIAEAGGQDIILVAGKGHEDGQIIGSGTDARIVPFSDVEVARECLSGAAAGQPS